MFNFFQSDTLKVRPLKNSHIQNQGALCNGKNPNEPQPVILMRAKGNPGILIEVKVFTLNSDEHFKYECEDQDPAGIIYGLVPSTETLAPKSQK